MRCGEPMRIDYIGVDSEGNFQARTWFQGDMAFTRGEFQVSSQNVESWYYNLGSRKFVKILKFRGGKLVSIESGPYGTRRR